MRRAHELVGEVDAGDAAAIGLGDIARRPADAATHVEDVHLGREAELGGKRDRGLAAAGMELIDRREVRERQPFDVLAVGGEQVEDLLFELGLRIVARHALLDRAGFRQGRLPFPPAIRHVTTAHRGRLIPGADGIGDAERKIR